MQPIKLIDSRMLISELIGALQERAEPHDFGEIALTFKDSWIYMEVVPYRPALPHKEVHVWSPFMDVPRGKHNAATFLQMVRCAFPGVLAPELELVQEADHYFVYRL